MRIEIADREANEKVVYAVHGNHEPLRWMVKSLDNNPFVREDYSLFQHINEYWSTLSESIQAEIFDVYGRINHAFQTVKSIETLDLEINPLINRLLALHPTESINSWRRIRSDIIIPGPPDLPLEYVESADRNHTRVKTYTVPDYEQLVNLVIQLRVMVPIWGEYIERTGGPTGTNYKEMYAYHLLAGTILASGQALNKLAAYIRAKVPPEGNYAAAVGFISSEDFPDWIMSLLVVRKLSLMDIRGIERKPILVQHISRSVSERLKRADNIFGGTIKKKDSPENPNISEENQHSLLEGFKMKPAHTVGDQALIEVEVSDPYAVAKRLCPDIDLKLVDEALLARDLLIEADVQTAQELLMQWMIEPVISPAMINCMGPKEYSQVLCVLEAVLWHEGHHFVAALATAIVPPKGADSVMSSSDSRGRMTKEAFEQLQKYYPYPARLGRSNRGKNCGVENIDTAIRLFSEHTWMTTVTPEKLAIINPRTPQLRRLTLPHNFRMLLAEVILSIAQKQEARFKAPSSFKTLMSYTGEERL